MTSFNSAYRGDGLDNHLRILGQERLPGETDWDFRKRVFPEVFEQDRRWAFEILIGKEPQDWGPVLETLFQELSLGKNPTPFELVAFSCQWSEDPMNLAWKASSKNAPT